jgi:hypothetical protein
MNVRVTEDKVLKIELAPAIDGLNDRESKAQSWKTVVFVFENFLLWCMILRLFCNQTM